MKQNAVDLSNFPWHYGFYQNGRIVILQGYNFKKARQFVKTLADMEKRDKYLYSINLDGEIYFCRKIKTCFNYE